MESSDMWANSTAGFKTAGLFPLSYPQMVGRAELFNSCGAGTAAQRANWLPHRPTMVSEVLTLPVKEKTGKGKKRKTIGVAVRLLTRDDLQQITAAPSKRRSVDFVEQQLYDCVV
uniref:AlNc14C119G6623 protein n=1 Tax=Albugo laibachii Nc14 TaxID=890382 RepID=F0WJ92_9STRA|nr:AlNc14C119G6623 [Albugo laibachii Nc14]|eukprot:CCA21339.1 AlNc14C119G6623 [Albugo laibachii Nc14]